MKNKKMIVFFLGIVVIALLGVTFYIINNNNKTNDINHESTVPNKSKNADSNNDTNIISKEQNNKEQNTLPTENSIKQPENSSLLFGKGDDTVDYYDHSLDISEDTHHDDLVTIFDEPQDIKSKIGFHLKHPEILKGSTIPFNFGETILAKNDYVAILADGKMLYYSPSTKEIKQIAENVTKAKSSTDGNYILFEEKVDKEYITYYYAFPISEDGKVEMISTMNPLKDFGVINQLFYYSSLDDEFNSYYYSPFNTSRDTIELDYFAVQNAYGTAINKESFIIYNQENQTFYTFEGRGKNKEKMYSVSTKKEKYLRILEVNPYRGDNVMLTGYSHDDNFPYSEKVYLNNKLLDNIKDIKKITWVNDNGFFYTDLSYENCLFYFDLKKKEKFILDSSVTSFTYDQEEKTLYYIKQDNKIRKIMISN